MMIFRVMGKNFEQRENVGCESKWDLREEKIEICVGK